jgi:DivIVA domain-containing protein
MMELTPLDVRKKKEDFRRVVRGYDPAQVDGFLDLVADRLDELVGRESRLRGQVDSIQEQLAAYRDRERALNDALVTAQELREEARAQAEKSADLKLREAEREAETIRREAELAVHGARRTLEDLQVRRLGFLRSLRASTERYLAELAEEERRFTRDEREGHSEQGSPRERESGEAPIQDLPMDGAHPAPHGDSAAG